MPEYTRFEPGARLAGFELSFVPMSKPTAPISRTASYSSSTTAAPRAASCGTCATSGFKTVVAEDGHEAMTQLTRAQPDLMLLDLMMPRRDGFSVLKAIRDTPALAELPVIVLTAMGDMDGRIRGMEQRRISCITKPFKLIELQTRATRRSPCGSPPPAARHRGRAGAVPAPSTR
jgi:CheY-like chemotaxis protein